MTLTVFFPGEGDILTMSEKVTGFCFIFLFLLWRKNVEKQMFGNVYINVVKNDMSPT